MTQSVRYQNGQLYAEHGAWFVRYRERRRQEDGSSKWRRRSKRLGSTEKNPRKSDIEPFRVAFMQKVNSGRAMADDCGTLSEFVETVFLPWTETELRASTQKGYREIWNNHISKRVGGIRLREFRTVDASRMLRAIAAEQELTKTSLQHIKSVLSGIFTHAKNEGAFDGANPVQGALIPRSAHVSRERRTPTIWLRSFGFSESCHCCPRRLSLPDPWPGCARANCAGWSGRTTLKGCCR